MLFILMFRDFPETKKINKLCYEEINYHYKNALENNELKDFFDDKE